MSSKAEQGGLVPFDTAVALFVFNRPDCTERTLAVIRSLHPSRLYVVADGPRPEHAADVADCAAVRQLIACNVDWPCALHTEYAGSNLGCGRRVASGIDWVFTHETEAIFLEDDCLPHPSFFRFCAELLVHYRQHERVAQICGSRIVVERPDDSTSYSFSRYGPVWGWASWRRAWAGYDFALRDWPARRKTDWLRRVTMTGCEAKVRQRIYDQLHAGRIDTWDYQWGYTKLVRGQLSVIPAINLIDNIGGGQAATHRQQRSEAGAARALPWPLQAPAAVETDTAYDREFSRHMAPSWWRRLVRRL